MNTPNILVTGASGFIGRHLCRTLLAEGLRVLAVSRSANHPSLAEFGDNPRFSPLQGNLQDRDFAESIFRNNEISSVFHFAVERFASDRAGGQLADLSATNAWKTNVLGTRNLLSAAAGHPVQAWIQGSAMLVYDLDNPGALPVPESRRGNPAEPNGLSVLMAEELCRYEARCHRRPTLLLRFPGVFGPGKSGGIVARLLEFFAGENGGRFHVPGNRSADFLYVHDAVRAAMLARAYLLEPSAPGTEKTFGECLHIGGGAEVPLVEVAVLLREITGSQRSPQIVWDAPPRRFYLDSTRAATVLGFQARPLAETLREFYQREFQRQKGA
ncbi:MAG: NAD(P)-dependent oxidoreductase [Calditrichaeota bacterium]|nr:NAD(P)-dependent oxidoreductase [Calditrichota bacterium]